MRETSSSSGERRNPDLHIPTTTSACDKASIDILILPKHLSLYSVALDFMRTAGSVTLRAWRHRNSLCVVPKRELDIGGVALQEQSADVRQRGILARLFAAMELGQFSKSENSGVKRKQENFIGEAYLTKEERDY